MASELGACDPGGWWPSYDRASIWKTKWTLRSLSTLWGMTVWCLASATEGWPHTVSKGSLTPWALCGCLSPARLCGSLGFKAGTSVESTSQDNVFVGPSQPPRGKVEISLNVTTTSVVLSSPEHSLPLWWSLALSTNIRNQRKSFGPSSKPWLPTISYEREGWPSSCSSWSISWSGDHFSLEGEGQRWWWWLPWFQCDAFLLPAWQRLSSL